MNGSGEVPECSGSKTNINQYNFNDPQFLHPIDNGVVSIISIKLNGLENFRIQTSSMIRDLKGRNKLGFVHNTFSKTATD